MNPEPARGKIVDPMDPWAAKANIAESLLDRYLLSKGINPKFVSKDTKISHAKSGTFLKWKQDHQFEETELDETMTTQHSPYELRQHALKKAKHMHKVKPAAITTNGLHESEIDENYMDPGKKTAADVKKIIKSKEKEKKETGIYKKENPKTRQKTINYLTKYARFTEEVDATDTITVDIPLMIRLLEYAREDAKTDMDLHSLTERLIEIRNKGTLSMADYDYVATGKHKVKEESELEEAKTIQGTALDKFRQAAAERARKHDDAEREMKARHASGKEDMKGAIDRLEKSLNKEEASNSEHAPATHAAIFHDENGKLSYVVHFHANNDKHAQAKAKTLNVLQRKDGKEDTLHSVEKIVREEIEQIEESGEFMKDVKKKVAAAKSDRYTHYSKTSKDMPKTADTYAQMAKYQKKLSQEETEQIDELKKSTVKSWLGQQDVVPTKKPGMDRKDFNKRIKSRSASWDRALDRLTGRKPTSEDAYQDSQAATLMPFDGANNTDDVSPKKREMSKSARIIKSIYKRKNMKEETYDWEKDDKNTQVIGKGVKIKKTEEEESYGDNKPGARSVMYGGKTLTGEKRDSVQIDPLMNNRPGPDVFSKDGKKSPN